MPYENILITGYEPWDTFESNPSGLVSEALGGIVLPVDFNEAPKILIDSVAKDTKAVVMLGLAANIEWIAIEKAAYNIKWDYLLEGSSPEEIVAGGSERLETDIPVNNFRDNLISNGFLSVVSYQPGDYVCNNLYYRALTYLDIPSVFIHIPLEEILPLDKTTEAVHLCLDKISYQLKSDSYDLHNRDSQGS